MNLTVIALLALGAEAPGDAWPGFRGDGTSVSAAKGLPTKWSAKENIAWSQELPGYGQSSPVVAGGLVYVTAIEGEQKEKLHVLAFDLAGGKLAWKREFEATQKGKNNSFMSRAAPTPVADAEGVVAFFGSGDLIALTRDGKERWRRALTKDYGPFRNNHGLGSSLAQSDRAVLVLVDHQGPSYLLAVDRATGKDLWKADRPGRASWTSPVVTRGHGREIALVSSNGSLAAYDLADGKPLWTHDELAGNTIPSATAVGDVVLVGAGENKKDPGSPAAAKSNACFRLVGKEGKPAVEAAWVAKKVVSSMASPLLHRGHAYFVTRAGVVACLDAKTGEQRYAERVEDSPWATPVGAGEHVYFFGKGGLTTVLKAGPAFEVVATNRILAEQPKAEAKGGYGTDGEIVYGAAVVDGAIVLRTGTQLFCIREAAEKTR